MNFSKWIEKMGGATRLAGKLGVSKAAVSQWDHGIALPNDERKQAIIKLSRGAISYMDIVRHYNNMKAARGAK